MPNLSDEMIKLRRMVLTMGAMVEHRVNLAASGLLRHDLGLCEEVRQGDDEVDRLDVDLEAECVEILALHAPVASDLRAVLAALRINADLERMADLARSVAKRTIKLEHLRPLERPPVLAELVNSVREAVSSAIQSLVQQDAHLAATIRRNDRAIDEKHRAVIAWSVGYIAQNPEHARAVIDLLSIVRALERIADLSVNIAEAVIFAKGGEIVRHLPVLDA